MKRAICLFVGVLLLPGLIAEAQLRFPDGTEQQTGYSPPEHAEPYMQLFLDDTQVVLGEVVPAGFELVIVEVEVEGCAGLLQSQSASDAGDIEYLAVCRSDQSDDRINFAPGRIIIDEGRRLCLEELCGNPFRNGIGVRGFLQEKDNGNKPKTEYVNEVLEIDVTQTNRFTGSFVVPEGMELVVSFVVNYGIASDAKGRIGSQSATNTAGFTRLSALRGNFVNPYADGTYVIDEGRVFHVHVGAPGNLDAIAYLSYHGYLRKKK